MADRSLLSRATESTQAPTPGYLYLDIAKNVASSPMACQDVATYLTNRLRTKHNANIKFKCLKVIAKVAESPITRGLFKRTMAQDSAAMASIKECLQYRGPPDPLRGDEPYEKVRTAAKEALDAIYSDTPSSMEYGQSQAAYATSGMGRMEGIGNPMFKDPRLEQANAPMTAETFIKEAADAVTGMIRDPLARGVDVGPSRSNMPGYGSSYPPGRSQLSQSTGGQWNMASNRGIDAIAPQSNIPANSDYYKQKQPYDWANKGIAPSGAVANTVGGSWGVPASSSVPATSHNSVQPPYTGMASAGHTTNYGHGGTAVSDGQYEKQLIIELCPPGGLKAEPPPDKLQRFLQSISSLDADLICPALLDCLEEGQPWVIRAKALCVMEACITVGVSENGVNKYADFFYECRSEIEPLAQHPRPAVKEPARRVMQLLGVTSTAVPSAMVPPTPPPPPPVAPPPPPADLLDFGQDDNSTPAVVSATSVPAASDNSSSTLFGGLKIQENSNPVPTPAPTSTVAAVNTSAVNALPVENLLSGLTLQEPSANSVENGFSFMDNNTSVTASNTTTASSFDFMQSSAPPEMSNPPPTSGSSFNFIQSSNSNPTASSNAIGSSFDFMQSQSPTTNKPITTLETAPSPATPAKATFDPLAQQYQPSTTQAGKAMPLNPLQLQTMYAQQLMMQQQMQQMQLAMAMQQGGIPGNVSGMPMPILPLGGFTPGKQFPLMETGIQPPTKKKEDKRFDFVQDAIKKEQK